jgi:hypothetical protein
MRRSLVRSIYRSLEASASAADLFAFRAAGSNTWIKCVCAALAPTQPRVSPRLSLEYIQGVPLVLERFCEAISQESLGL